MDSSFPGPSSAAVPRIVTTAAAEDRPSQASEKTYYNSDSSGTTTPEERSPGYVLGGMPASVSAPDACANSLLAYQTGSVSSLASLPE